MLVLSRKTNEKIKIGEDIEITIVSVSGEVVRVGIEAPKEVKILRSEVYEEISRQNQAAAETKDNKFNQAAISLLRTKLTE